MVKLQEVSRGFLPPLQGRDTQTVKEEDWKQKILSESEDREQVQDYEGVQKVCRHWICNIGLCKIMHSLFKTLIPVNFCRPLMWVDFTNLFTMINSSFNPAFHEFFKVLSSIVRGLHVIIPQTGFQIPLVRVQSAFKLSLFYAMVPLYYAYKVINYHKTVPIIRTIMKERALSLHLETFSLHLTRWSWGSLAMLMVEEKKQENSGVRVWSSKNMVRTKAQSRISC